MDRPSIVLLAAVARNGVIGDGGGIPWHLPEDLRRFREITIGHPVLMGRRTWQSLPERFRPLPGRRNLVLSRSGAVEMPGAERFASIDSALAAVDAGSTTFVIGGAEIYAAALPLADELRITEVDRDFAGGVRFPAWDREAFEETNRERRDASTDGGLAYSFVVYRRRPGAEGARSTAPAALPGSQPDSH